VRRLNWDGRLYLRSLGSDRIKAEREKDQGVDIKRNGNLGKSEKKKQYWKISIPPREDSSLMTHLMPHDLRSHGYDVWEEGEAKQFRNGDYGEYGGGQSEGVGTP